MSFDPRRIEVIDDESAAVLRAKSGAERVRMIDELMGFYRRAVTAKLRRQYPHWTEAEIENEIARRIAGGDQ